MNKHFWKSNKNKSLDALVLHGKWPNSFKFKFTFKVFNNLNNLQKVPMRYATGSLYYESSKQMFFLFCNYGITGGKYNVGILIFILVINLHGFIFII